MLARQVNGGNPLSAEARQNPEANETNLVTDHKARKFMSKNDLIVKGFLGSGSFGKVYVSFFKSKFIASDGSSKQSNRMKDFPARNICLKSSCEGSRRMI